MIRWITHRPWFPISLIALSFLLLSSGIEVIFSNPMGIVFSGLLSLSFLLSNRFTWYSISLLPVAGIAMAFLSTEPLVSLAAMFALTFLITVFAAGKQRILLIPLAATTALAIPYILIFQGNLFQEVFGLSGNTPSAQLNFFFIVFALSLVGFAASYGFGRLVDLSLHHIGTPRDLALSNIRSNSLRLEFAKQNERLEIAKDLSELLVQRVTAVVSVSEGGRYSVVADPNSASRILERTYEAGRAAQAELRRLYDYLNSAIISDVENFHIDDLLALAVSYRELGYNAVITNQGQKFSLNEGMELCVYKIVFEALKNVRKHAPLGTDIDIDFLWVEDGLQVLVKDNGIEVSNRLAQVDGGAAPSYTAQDDLESLVQEFDGATLSALRDRAAIYFGKIEANKVPGVGFTLSAIFPNLKSLSLQSN